MFVSEHGHAMAGLPDQITRSSPRTFNKVPRHNTTNKGIFFTPLFNVKTLMYPITQKYLRYQQQPCNTCSS